MIQAKDNYKLTFMEWDRRISRSNEMHYESAKRLRNKHYYLGIPAIIIVTLLGALKDVHVSDQCQWFFTLLYTALAVVAAVTVGLQTFLNFNQRAEKHKEMASEYGSLRREVEHIAKKPFKDEKEIEDAIISLKSKLDTLSKMAPEANPKVWKKVNGKFKKGVFKSTIFD